jgi:PmbA protein
LPDVQDVVQEQRDLDLFHPWAIESQQAMHLAFACEAAALNTSKRITNSEGAAVSAQQSHFFMGNSRGFRGGYASSRHSISVAPIASLPGRRGDDMQRDAWYSSMRDPSALAAPEAIGRYAAQRALSRLKSTRIPTCEVPVLFEAPVAAGLLGALVQSISGGALYRKATFLVDSLGKQILPLHVDIDEDPYRARGKGSAPFDDEGVLTHARRVVDGGIIQGYFLSTYSARKLGMRTTGHAGGSHNLSMSSRTTQPGDSLDAMIAKLGRGLFVTDLMGQGVNHVTGDYSRGASGFWVEDGRLVRPVEEITIAGNLRQMLGDIIAIGADVYEMGAKSTGSVLIDRMKVAGS